MNYTPKQLFADWYRSIEANPSPDVIRIRIIAIEEILEIDDLNFWLDLVQLYLGLKSNPASIQKFCEIFKKHDPTFPLINNENLIKTLGAITLIFQLNLNQDSTNNLISTSLLNAIFFEKVSTDQRIPVANYAKNQIKQADSNVRTLNEAEVDGSVELIEKLLDDEDEENTDEDFIFSGEEGKAAFQTIKFLVKANKIVREESNILWWIFGEYSYILGKSFKEIALVKMIPVAALELANETNFTINFSSSLSILHRALISAKPTKTKSKELSLHEVVEATDNSIKTELVGVYYDKVSALTPALMAFKCSLEHGDDWLNSYSNIANNYDLTKKFEPEKISFQIYNELIFLKSLC